MKKYILLIVLLPFLLLACNNDGTSSTESKSKETDKKFHVTYDSGNFVDSNEYSYGDTIILQGYDDECDGRVIKTYTWYDFSDRKTYKTGSSYVIKGDTEFGLTLNEDICQTTCLISNGRAVCEDN